MSKDEINAIAPVWFLRIVAVTYVSATLYYAGRAAWLFKQRDTDWIDAGGKALMLIVIVVGGYFMIVYLMLPDHALPR